MCTQLKDKVKLFEGYSYGEMYHCTTLSVALSVQHEYERILFLMVLRQPNVDDLKSFVINFHKT